MSEIDVSKCAFYNNGKCNNPNCTACNCCNNAYCYYKELQQAIAELKQYKESKQASYEAMQDKWNKAVLENRELKAENEKLKEQVDKYKEQTDVELRLINDALETCMNSYKECSDRYKNALDEIEKVCKDNFCTFADGVCDGLGGEILQLIKQAKEGE